MARRTGIPAAYRLEHDSMGELRVPADALWGAPRIMAALTDRRLIGPGDLLLAQPPAAADATSVTSASNRSAKDRLNTSNRLRRMNRL